MSVKFDIVFTILFVTAGMFLFLRNVWLLLGAVESRRWPNVQGLVVASQVEDKTDSEGGRLYRPRVSYRYSVNGQDFVGERACFGDADYVGWALFARDIVARYRVRSPVTVHYDPSDPADAVLEPGLNGLLFSTLIFSIAFLGFSILMLRAVVAA